MIRESTKSDAGVYGLLVEVEAHNKSAKEILQISGNRADPIFVLGKYLTKRD